ncbi:MAG TPA: porin family protein [Bacteroidales bacterium]
MKRFTLLAVAFFLSSFLMAQWQFGPRLGMNFSTLSGEGYWGETDHGWIVGRIIGGVVTYSLDDHLSLVGEINHITSGGKFNYNYYDEESRSLAANEGQWKEIYSNVQLPIMVKYTIGDNIQFYGEIGPYFNFSLAGRYKDQIEEIDWEEKGKIRFVNEYPDDPAEDTWYIDTEYYRRCDVGMNFGVGAQRELGKGFIALDLRFGLGFLDCNKFPDNDQPDDYKPYKNRNIALSVAYMFPCNK